ncbi:hypothetical protein MON38_03240 [Hymenobacter sp. DH14]|uniref:Uncharacterized protein n=1 Tax=Hymenobacter cyanobacteriorum TaxID=2926463 RepID=A0A9X1VC64_9BACT|nr:hypothetical protein [Hymenobacter cyanobacteriorum]MCI1186419.1 hypothetical protein [Hymenobacter cyanobacteriorum]
MRSYLFLARPQWWGGLLLLFVLRASPAARAQVYYLDLSKQPLALSGRVVSVEQVVDGRPGRPASVGTVYQGLHDKTSPVVFRHSLETELTAWLAQQLPARATDHAVVLCLRQLLVGEAVTSNLLVSKAASTAELAVDVYAHRPDGYHFVRSASAHSSQPGTAINADHALHVARLMQQCLATVAAADLAAAAQRPARTLAEVAARPAPVARPAILQAAAPRRGVYFSAEQFAANQPDTTVQLRLDTVRWSAVRASLLDANMPMRYVAPDSPPRYSRTVINSPSGWKGTVQLKGKVRTTTGDRVPTNAVWGFSDGRQAYVYQEHVFRLLTRQHDFFTFVGAAPVDVAAFGQRALGTRPSQPARPGTGLRGDANDGSGEPMVLALSLRTGQFSQYPPPGQPQRADTAFIYVYRPLGGPAEAQPVLFNDRQVGQLRPGESVELTWPHLGQAVRLGTAGSAALVLVPSTSVANYVRLQPDTDLTTWQVMPPAQGEAEVDALEKRP